MWWSSIQHSINPSAILCISTPSLSSTHSNITSENMVSMGSLINTSPLLSTLTMPHKALNQRRGVLESIILAQAVLLLSSLYLLNQRSLTKRDQQFVMTLRWDSLLWMDWWWAPDADRSIPHSSLFYHKILRNQSLLTKWWQCWTRSLGC